MKRLSLVALFALGGCGFIPGTDAYLVRHAKIAVGAELLDPASASYKNLKNVKVGEADYVCGEVNSKNRFGGYAGWRRFQTVMFNSTNYITWPDDLENELEDNKSADNIAFYRDQMKIFSGISDTEYESAKRARDGLIISRKASHDALKSLLSSYTDICTGAK